MGIKELFSKHRLITSIIAISVIILVFLVLVKNSKPEFNFSTYLIFLVVIDVVGIGGFLVYQNYGSLLKKQETDFPDPISPEEGLRLIHKKINSSKYENHIVSHLRDYSETVNKNEIRIYPVNLLYEDNDFKNPVYILLNATYPTKKDIGILSNPSIHQLNRAINNMSLAPAEDPQVKESETTDLLSGRVHRYKETTPPHKEDKSKEKEKEE